MTSENINEFLDELFIMTKKEMIRNKGQSIQAFKGVFIMSFSLIDACDINVVFGSEYYNLSCIIFVDIKSKGKLTLCEVVILSRSNLMVFRSLFECLDQ